MTFPIISPTPTLLHRSHPSLLPSPQISPNSSSSNDYPSSIPLSPASASGSGSVSESFSPQQIFEFSPASSPPNAYDGNLMTPPDREIIMGWEDEGEGTLTAKASKDKSKGKGKIQELVWDDDDAAPGGEAQESDAVRPGVDGIVEGIGYSWDRTAEDDSFKALDKGKGKASDHSPTPSIVERPASRTQAVSGFVVTPEGHLSARCSNAGFDNREETSTKDCYELPLGSPLGGEVNDSHSSLIAFHKSPTPLLKPLMLPGLGPNNNSGPLSIPTNSRPGTPSLLSVTHPSITGSGSGSGSEAAIAPPAASSLLPQGKTGILRSTSSHQLEPSTSPALNPHQYQHNSIQPDPSSSPLILPTSSSRPTRSRAQSIAFSLSPSIRTNASGSGSPSPSIRSKFSDMKGKLKRSGSSMLGINHGNGSQSQGQLQIQAQDVATVESEIKPKKGKMKGLVKRYMTRTRSSLSVPTTSYPLSSSDEPLDPVLRPPVPVGILTRPTATEDLLRKWDLHAERSEHPSTVRSHHQHPTLGRRAMSVDGALMTPGRSIAADLVGKMFYDELAIDLDIDPDEAVDVTDLEEESPPPCHFHEMLPHELQLRVLSCLVGLHVRQHERDLEWGRWKGERARSTRWFGVTAGMRELVKLSRVSKEWRALAFDGQLWSNADMRPYLDILPPSTLFSILTSAGSFAKELNLRGWQNLPDRALRRALLGNAEDHRLENLDLRGCRAISSDTIIQLLRRSSRLRKINFKALPSVDLHVMKAIKDLKLTLEDVDVSFCRETVVSVDPSPDEVWPKLKVLRVAGTPLAKAFLRNVALAMPNLEVLDISNCTRLQDQDFCDMVSVTTQAMTIGRPTSRNSEFNVQTVELRSSQAGQPATHGDVVLRQVLRLRHLNFSGCKLVTDKACQYLAFALPDLEFLEMAGLGSSLQDGGVVALLSTTPYIKKLDLEGASEITDRVLSALTPSKEVESIRPQPGVQLESLSIGFASAVTNDAMLRLLRACPKLVEVGFDNTSVTDVFVKEFIRRRARSSFINVIDCRHVSRNTVEVMLSKLCRPRAGWRGYEAVPFAYQDGIRPRAGYDECSDMPVLQSFWTWHKVPRSPGSMTPGSRRTRLLTEDEQEFLSRYERHRSGDARGCIIM